ncbi:MAG TPA: YdeI/OmpD-associated family protein [Actinomycetes bacterium]|nr:YdeI/OmpD-associated family protein [Actinomycetes bacterium]
MRFHTTIVQSGKTATGIEVPEEVVAGLGAGRRPKVVVTVNGYTYRSSIAPMNGSHWVGFSSEHREASGLGGGDEVDVELEVDTAPREVTLPEDFAAALDAEPAARQTWDGLSYSNRSWHALQIAGARTEETRQRRIDKSIAALREGRPR